MYLKDKDFAYILTGDLQLVKHSFSEADGEVLTVTGSKAPAPEKKEADLLENIGGSKNPRNKYFTLPRLFVINNDGSGYELLAKEQLDYYFRMQKHNQEVLKLRKDVIIGSTSALVHNFLTKVRTLTDRQKDATHLKHLEFPTNSLYTLLHLKEMNPGYIENA